MLNAKKFPQINFLWHKNLKKNNNRNHPTKPTGTQKYPNNNKKPPPNPPQSELQGERLDILNKEQVTSSTLDCKVLFQSQYHKPKVPVLQKSSTKWSNCGFQQPN